MAYALIDHTAAGSTDGNGVTTGAINTTGADLLVAVISDYSAGGGVSFSDSKGNTWALLTQYNDGVAARVQIAYVKSPSVGSGHTFTATNAFTFPSVCVAAFSGSDLSAPFDQQNGASNSSTTSQQPGSVTPSANNELLIAGVSFNGAFSGLSVNSSFTSLDSAAYAGGACLGSALGYKIQTSAGAENPTWSWTGTAGAAADIATFKAVSGGGGTDQPIEKRHGGVPFATAMQLRGGVRGGVW